MKVSAQLQGAGNQIAMILFNDEANYFWMPLQRQYPGGGNPPVTSVSFQKVLQGQVTGDFGASSSDRVYLRMDREVNDYSGYFATLDPAKTDNVEQIQWTKLGTLPGIRFQGKLALCAVNTRDDSPEVAAEFYSVLIRQK